MRIKTTHTYIALFLVLASCKNHEAQLMGEWTTTSAFYSAEYQIGQEKGHWVGRIISYNDGTSSFNDSTQQRPRYLFKNLEYQDSCFVDGTSGATKKVNDLVIKTIGSDSLEVTSLIMNHPISEIWVRKSPLTINK